MGAGAAKPTNEELIERLQAAGEGTPGAAASLSSSRFFLAQSRKRCFMYVGMRIVKPPRS